MPGNHGYPVLSSEEIVRHIYDSWEAGTCCDQRAVCMSDGSDYVPNQILDRYEDHIRELPG